MKHRLKIIAATLTLAMSAAQAQDLFSHNKPVEFEFLQEISASATIGKHPIIPTGRPHRLLDLTKGETSGLGSGLPLGFAWMADLEDKQVVALLHVLTNLSQNPHIGEPVTEPCKGDGFIWKHSTKGKFSNIECATIRHIVFHCLGECGRLGEVIRKLNEKGMKLPDEVLVIELSRYMEQGRMLWYTIFLDPKALEQEFRQDMKWSPVYLSEGRYDDPGKQAVLEHLKSWATQAQEHMSQALFLKPEAFKELPDLLPTRKPATQ